MSERELRNAVIEALEMRGYFVVWLANEFLRERFKSRGLRKGLPDLLVLSNRGEAYFVELKAGRNGLTEAQKAIKAELEKRGFKVFVIRSLDELKQNFTEYEQA